MSSTEQATVLVVDDEPDVADAYGAQLKREFNVKTAYGGEEALEKLDENVEVVLLDRRMPGLSGDEVLDEMRERNFDVRVAMVTAVDPGFDIIDMPFDDYAIKPVSRDDLFETVNRLLDVGTYENQMQRFYSLSAKHATLTANKPRSELEESEEFQELKREMNELRSDIDQTVSEFDDQDFEAAFREI